MVSSIAILKRHYLPDLLRFFGWIWNFYEIETQIVGDSMGKKMLGEFFFC